MIIKLGGDDVVPVLKAARQLNKPKMTIYRWIEADKIVGINFGGILFIPVSEIERLKNAQATGEQPAA